MRLKALCLTALLCAPALPVQAETSPISALRISADLFAIAREQQDPLMMITAAKLRKTVSLTATDRAPDGGMAEDGRALDWRDMLAAATALAGDDDTLSGLIESPRPPEG